MSQFFWTRKMNFGPKPRFEHAMVFDTDRKSTFLFGGDSIVSGLLNDTWEWDGKNWIQVADMGPEPRSRHAMTYNNVQKKVMLFGGHTADKLNDDTWEWKQDFWVQVANTGPSPRAGHAIVFDGVSNRLILFGGESDGASLQNDTWAWDGERWTKVADSGPSKRKGHVMIFDSKSKRVILFGGQDETTVFGDTWTWNGSQWGEITPFGASPCSQSSMIDARNSAILFGGHDASKLVFGNTWQWNGTRWKQTLDMGPVPRRGHSMVYDSDRTSIVLFGGCTNVTQPETPSAQQLLGDTWELFNDETKVISEVTASTIASFPGYYVFDLAVGPNDSLYVTMTGDQQGGIMGNRIVEVIPANGTINVKIDSRVLEPHGITVDNENNIYVSLPPTMWAPSPGQEINMIKKIATTGEISSFAGSGEPGSKDGVGAEAQFINPLTLTADKANNIYVLDKGNNSIRKISSTLEVTTVPGAGLNLHGIACDAENNLYMISATQILKISSSGELTTVAENGAAGITSDLKGNIYIIDSAGIRKIDPSGQMTTIARTEITGHQDSPAAAATSYDTAVPIVCDSKGDIFVLDTGNQSIRKIVSG